MFEKLVLDELQFKSDIRPQKSVYFAATQPYIFVILSDATKTFYAFLV